MSEITQNTRYVGTSAFGIRMPIIKQGDDIANIISDTIINDTKATYLPLSIHNGDIVGVTEFMRAKLNEADVVEGDEEGLCDGSCEGCTMCGDAADEDEAEDAEVEAEAEADVNE